MDAPANDGNRLGAYLKDRRARLDPTAFGFSQKRRRTPGLRREEVAQRANISPTWYTWLEQGRGGAPSADVLQRIARALMLTDVEREHLFLLGQGRPPERQSRRDRGVTPRLQRVLDALEPSAAMIRTATWDVVAWNRAVPVVLADYGALPPSERNILRQLFCNPRSRNAQENWESAARFVIGAFRADVVRAGAVDEVTELVDELRRVSPDFDRIWRDNEVSDFGGGVKRMRHPVFGTIELEYSSFAVDGRADLSMIVYAPMTAGHAEKVRSLIAAREEAGESAT
ncbi:MAG: helix-turn-helix domain-containing protein [Bauldia sp.]|nr:helix-turn-helix domain-containing protein [Bauldia sp.]